MNPIPIKFTPGTKWMAIIGPFDKPEAKLVVEILRPAKIAGFHEAVTNSGAQLLIHREKLKPILVFVAMLITAACGAALMPEITQSVVTTAIVTGQHDGDTLSVAIPGHRAFVGPVRLKDVFAKELATAGGKRGLTNLMMLAPVGSKVRVLLEYTKEGTGIESLCRPIARIWIEATGLDVNETQAAWLKLNHLSGGIGTH